MKIESNLNSIEHLVRLKPDQTITQIRSELGSFGIGEDIAENPVETLSGGQKARLLLSLATIDNPHLIILDEPTIGVDVGAKAEVYEFLASLAAEGVAVLLISSELPEILNMSNRVYVIRSGTVQAHFEGQEISEENLLNAFFSESAQDNSIGSTRPYSGNNPDSHYRSPRWKSYC